MGWVGSGHTKWTHHGQLCTVQVYELVAVVRDVHQPTMSSSTHVTVYVSDVNDHAPRWLSPSPSNSTTAAAAVVVPLSSLTAPGTAVARVRAADADAGENGRVTYSVAAPRDRDAPRPGDDGLLGDLDWPRGDLDGPRRGSDRQQGDRDGLRGGDDGPRRDQQEGPRPRDRDETAPFDVDPDTGVIRLRADLSDSVRRWA